MPLERSFLEVVKMISRYSDSFTNHSSFHQFLFNIEIRQKKVELYFRNKKERFDRRTIAA